MKKKVLIALMPMMMLSASETMAASWCEKCGVAVGAAWYRLGAKVSSGISSAASSIQAAFLQATSQLSQELEKRMAAGVKTTDASLAWQTQRDLQHKQVELAKTYSTPVSCCDGTSTSAMARTVRAARTRAAEETRAIAELSAGKEPTQAVIAKRWDEYAAKYCTDEDVAAGKCETSGGPMAAANIKASTLYQPSEGQMYNEKEAAAAKEYIGLVLEPVPPQPVPAALLNTQQGRHLQAVMDARQAALSTAAWSLSRIYASRQVPPAESSAR
jgi:hypothetical protein